MARRTPLRQESRPGLVSPGLAPYGLSSREVEDALAGGGRDRELQDLFGDTECAELRALAQAARSRKQTRTGRPHVLILPGIMGSKLGIDRPSGSVDELWFDWWDWLRGRLTRLTLDPPPRPIVAFDVFPRYYVPLKTRLDATGRYTTEFFPYDWRQPIEETGRLLKDRIDKIGDVVVVAHSMGGLVARAAMRLGARVRRLITLGTPHFGSFSPVLALNGDHDLVGLMEFWDFNTGRAAYINGVFSSFPGLAQMLPAPPRWTGLDFFAVGSWPHIDGIGPRSTVLERSRNLGSHLQAPDDRFRLIVGIGRSTIVSADRAPEDNGFRYTATLDGDGTVPLALARLDAVPTWEVAEDHGDLPRNRDVAAAVIDLIDHGDSAGPLARHDPVRVHARAAAAPTVVTSRNLRALHPSGGPRPSADPAAVSPGALRARVAELDPRVIERMQAGLMRTDLPAPATARALDSAESPAALSVTHASVMLTRPRLELQLVTGSITHVNSRAYVVGVFQGVRPRGAATAIDEPLGKLIDDVTSRGVFVPTLGRPFLLPVARRQLRTDYVVLMGLGGFDTFSPASLRRATASLVETLVSIGIEEFATVLMGAGTAPDEIEALVGNLLLGIFDSLDANTVGTRLRRVTLCDLDPAVMARIDTRLDGLLTQPPFNLRDVPRERLAAPPSPQPPGSADPARTAVAAAEDREPAYLWLETSNDASGDLCLNQTVLGATSTASLDRASTPYTLAAVHATLAALLPDPAHPGRPTLKDIERAGAAFARQLVDRSIDARLADVLATASSLTLVHDVVTSLVPWEIVPFAGAYPAIDRGLSRRLADMQTSPARRAALHGPGPVRVLIVANPTGDLAGAAAEGRAVVEAINRFDASGTRVSVKVLAHEQATRSLILRELKDTQYHLVHYAGHGFFDPNSRGRSGLICHGDEVLTADHLAALPRLPQVIVFNACEVGRVRKARGRDSRRSIRAADRVRADVGVAEACLAGGVAAYISTFWPVLDAAASVFARDFYQDLLTGATVGAALRHARHALYEARQRDWANYVHYGDPRVRVVHP